MTYPECINRIQTLAHQAKTYANIGLINNITHNTNDINALYIHVRAREGASRAALNMQLHKLRRRNQSQ